MIAATVAPEGECNVAKREPALIRAWPYWEPQELEPELRRMTWHRSSEISGRLEECPGVGPVPATGP
jgi:hypothetical protein